MPIRPSQKHRYPDDWDAISARIRYVRADHRCECTGGCGSEHHGGRCNAPNGERIVRKLGKLEDWRRASDIQSLTRVPSQWRGRSIKVVLTVSHLNHTPEDCRDENLLAMCQCCHLRHDKFEHGRNAAETRRRRRKHPGQTTLPGME